MHVGMNQTCCVTVYGWYDRTQSFVSKMILHEANVLL